MVVQTPSNRNYILFSDVHLGADLLQHVRPWTLAQLKRAARIDRDLVTMLDHYRTSSDPERPWCLVIAGDLVDFIGMSISPVREDTLQTRLNREERRHGLGSAEEHAALKMVAVVERHAKVFDALTQFVLAGHSLVLVRGNHDVDFHWELARNTFVQALLTRASAELSTPLAQKSFEERIEFYPWFYYIEGLLYVEHGHQYDAFCSHSDVLAPLHPTDPQRTSWSLSDVLLRFIVHPTPGISSEGHEHNSTWDYLRMAARMGMREAMALGTRYVRAIVHAVHVWRAHVHQKAHEIRAEHDRRTTELAERMRLEVDKVRNLAQLAATPATRHLRTILRSLYADRVMYTVFSLCIFLLLGWTRAPWTVWVSASLVLGLLYALIVQDSRKLRVIDPSESLRQSAARIASLLPARYVVMGHTHRPRFEALNDKTTYINLGHWGSDDLAYPSKQAPCTHLVIRHLNGQHQAAFFAWSPDTGLHRVDVFDK